MDNNTIEKLFNIIEGFKEKMVGLQTDLNAVPALSPESGGDGEWEKAEVLKKRLRELGFSQIEQIDAPDDRVSTGKRPSIIVTIPGKDASRCFWIMTHMDIVPPGEPALWDTSPYKVVQKDGKLYGRGVEDNQQCLVASVFAAAGLMKAGITPEYTVKLLFVADEETGSDYGAKYIIHNHDIFGKEDMFLVPDGGNKEGTMIEIAEKNVLWLKIITKGKQCHASMPGNGNNSFVAGSAMVMALDELNRKFDTANPLFDPPTSTFSPTKKEANVPNINTIPGEDVFYLDSRILPSVGIEAVMKEIHNIKQPIEKKYGVQIEIEKVQEDASPPTPVDAPIVGILKEAVRLVYKKEGRVMGIGGGTVASHLRQKGYDTVVWSKIAESLHMPNEYCIIENMIGDCKVMASIMCRK